MAHQQRTSGLNTPLPVADIWCNALWFPPISERTLERDLKSLRDDFKIDIAYDRAKRGYFLNIENQEEIQEFLKFIEIIKVGQLFEDGLSDFDDFSEIVQLDNS